MIPFVELEILQTRSDSGGLAQMTSKEMILDGGEGIRSGPIDSAVLVWLVYLGTSHAGEC